MRKLEPHATALGSEAAFEHLYVETHTASNATWLRSAHTSGGSTAAIVGAALRRFREGG